MNNNCDNWPNQKQSARYLIPRWAINSISDDRFHGTGTRRNIRKWISEGRNRIQDWADGRFRGLSLWEGVSAFPRGSPGCRVLFLDMVLWDFSVRWYQEIWIWCERGEDTCPKKSGFRGGEPPFPPRFPPPQKPCDEARDDICQKIYATSNLVPWNSRKKSVNHN